ncbi:mitochondrial 54S ribosomal protein uL5m [Calcarisporiella thermophila]|uniref:mitochondrial 54S ribosomal protein uL5m n=1 Tax=Calcarisporiella thermophila TaxID=911321 RepID=UPI0037447DAD
MATRSLLCNLARTAPSPASKRFYSSLSTSGVVGLTRLREHYYTTLQDDLMYLTYEHPKPDAPVTESKANKIRRGNKPLKPTPPPKSSRTVPELQKIDVHCMVKEAILSKTNLLSAIMAIQSITGVRPEIVFARTGAATWKLREGMPIGCKVTLKGDKMYTFLDKLVEIVLPRMKEWQGLPITAGDGNGNIAMGFPASALSLFPDIESNYDMYPRMTGFHVVFNTTAYTNLDGRLLLSGFGIPFQKKMGKKSS